MSTTYENDVVHVVDSMHSSSGEPGYMVQFKSSVDGPDFVPRSTATIICPLKVVEFYEHELEDMRRRLANLQDYSKLLERNLENEHVYCEHLRAANVRLTNAANSNEGKNWSD